MNEVKNEAAIEDLIFRETFFCLKISGFWKPTTIKQRWLRTCFSFYTIFAAFSVSLIITGSIMGIVTAKEDIFGHFVQNWCLPGIVCHTWSNGVNLAIKRKRILNLLRTKIMIERWTRFRDPEEAKIIEASKAAEGNLVRYWMVLVVINAVMNVLVPVITYNPDNNLVWDSWQPCDVRASRCYWMCYSQQVFCYMISSIIHVSGGTITLNFIERICSHIRILQHRLTLLPELVRKGMISTAEDERIYLKECIHDHQNIYHTTTEISRIFYPVIFMHFILILSILCTNIYLLSIVSPFTSDFMAVGLFLCCMLSHFFIFCWWGYKLTQAGNDIAYTIFSMDWFELRKETRTRLRFIMLSASKTIPLFNNFIVDLSPEMFLKILKVSYSAFNLLQTQN